VRRRRRRRSNLAGIRRVRGVDIEVGVVPLRLLLRLGQPRLELGVGQGLACAELGRPLEWHTEVGLARPHALKIRLAPRRPRRVSRRRTLRARTRRADDHHQTNEDDEAVLHG
jgi:hypothetical protein